MFDRLATRIIVYTATLVLVVLIIFSVSSITTITILKKYTLNKTEQVFKENAHENLEKEVISYARILKNDMEAKKGVSYMFGEVVEDKIRKAGFYTVELENIYGEINNVLNLRTIAIFDQNGNKIIQYPDFCDVKLLQKFVKGLVKRQIVSKIRYYDFHVNGDDSVSFSFVYLGRDNKRKPIFIAFDYNPYDFYELARSAQLQPYSQKYLWIINKEGFLIYDPPTKEHPLITLLDHEDLKDPKNGKLLSEIVKNYILKGKSGVARYTFRGVDKFVGYTYVKEFGWGLGLTLPTRIFYKPINELNADINAKTTYTLALFGLFSAMVVLLAIIVSFFLSKKLVDPINRTVDAVEAILNGDYHKRLPESQILELNELAKAVNRLMDYFSKK